jgi:hypothetical protein
MEQILVCSGFVRASHVYEIEKLKTVVASRVGGAASTASSHPPKRADVLRFGALLYFSPGAVLEPNRGSIKRNADFL